MSIESVFRLQLIFGYAAWLLCYFLYIRPKLRTMPRANVHRAIATLHAFRFYGLVFLVPGAVSTSLPVSFASFAAWWDFATALLAMAAVLSFRIRPLFWFFVAAFNLVGIIDLISDYVHAMATNVPANAGLMASAYWIPVLYVPLLMITHVVALVSLLRPQAAQSTAPAPVAA